MLCEQLYILVCFSQLSLLFRKYLYDIIAWIIMTCAIVIFLSFIYSFLITLFISTLIWKSLSIKIFLYCCMLIWTQISDYTCTTLFWDRCKWLKILIHRYREVGDSWFLQCVAMCFVSLVSKHPLQLNDVVQPAGRSWPSDKSILCIYDVYEWWQ